MNFIKDYLFRLEHQIPEALAIGHTIRIPEIYRNVENILFCGVGGSAIGCDILKLLALDRSRLYCLVQRGGKWAKWAGKNTLVVLSSYSGNTEEVLQYYPHAKKEKCPMLIVTSGGKLGKLAMRNRIPYLRIPAGFAPRMAIGYSTFSLLPTLEQVARFHVPEHELKEIRTVIREVPVQKAHQIAKCLVNKSVFVYAPTGLFEAAALRWRTQFEENAKTLASHQIIPEMFHNEVEGWQLPKRTVKKSAAVFLIDGSESDVIRKKRQRVGKLIQKQGGTTLEVQSQGTTPLSKLFSVIALGDCISYELAKLHRVDPSVIPLIDSVKKIA